jgi:hypothetical protein
MLNGNNAQSQGHSARQERILQHVQKTLEASAYTTFALFGGLVGVALAGSPGDRWTRSYAAFALAWLLIATAFNSLSSDSKNKRRFIFVRGGLVALVSSVVGNVVGTTLVSSGVYYFVRSGALIAPGIAVFGLAVLLLRDGNPRTVIEVKPLGVMAQVCGFALSVGFLWILNR